MKRIARLTVGILGVPTSERLRSGLVVPTVLLALAVVLVLPHSGRSAPLAVDLVAKEFLFAPKDVTARTGAIVFVVQNQGAIEHNLVVGLPGGKRLAQIEIIEPGETRRIEASLPAGTYNIYCGLPGHKEAGMVATLRVNP